jgi:hypothetical protein
LEHPLKQRLARSSTVAEKLEAWPGFIKKALDSAEAPPMGILSETLLLGVRQLVVVDTV